MSEFESSLKKIKSNNKLSESQKIKMFYDLCKKNNIEPIVLRLSGYIKKNNFLNSDYLINFTPSRIIFFKKNNFRKLVDMGYTAGLGPYLYYILSDKVSFSDVKIKDSFISQIDDENPPELCISYHDIKKIVYYYDISTLVSNMLGTAVKTNQLKIYTTEKLFEYSIPTSKNGDYNKTFYWMTHSLPIAVYGDDY